MPHHDVGDPLIHGRVEVGFSRTQAGSSVSNRPGHIDESPHPPSVEEDIRNLRLSMMESEVACLSNGCPRLRAASAKSVMEACTPYVD